MNPNTKAGAPVPWSYSSLTAYEQCPRRFHLTRIMKSVKEQQHAASIDGNDKHRALELYVGGKAAMPTKYAGFIPIADRIRASKGTKLLEYRFGLTQKLKPTTFFGSDVWTRGVIDVAVVQPKSAVLLDYKAGKRKPDSDQLRMFAMAGFSLWPHVDTIKTGFVWLATREMDTETFSREDQLGIFQEFSGRVHRMERAASHNDWPPRPSGLCKAYCPVGRINCEHCGS